MPISKYSWLNHIHQPPPNILQHFSTSSSQYLKIGVEFSLLPHIAVVFLAFLNGQVQFFFYKTLENVAVRMGAFKKSRNSTNCAVAVYADIGAALPQGLYNVGQRHHAIFSNSWRWEFPKVLSRDLARIYTSDLRKMN